MRLSPIVMTLVLLGLASPATAQDHDEQLWFELGSEFSLGEGVALSLETNQRLSDADRGLTESQYLAQIDIVLAEGVTLSGGVNRVIAVDAGQIDNTEWRPRQQIDFDVVDLGAATLEGRLRIEQRFRDDGDEVGHRIRPRLVYSLPISRKLKLAIGHESYFNLNTTDFGQQAGHERMRNYVSVSFPIADHVGMSVGYLNQYRFNGGEQDVMQHAITLSLSAKL